MDKSLVSFLTHGVLVIITFHFRMCMEWQCLYPFFFTFLNPAWVSGERSNFLSGSRWCPSDSLSWKKNMISQYNFGFVIIHLKVPVDIFNFEPFFIHNTSIGPGCIFENAECTMPKLYYDHAKGRAFPARACWSNVQQSLPLTVATVIFTFRMNIKSTRKRLYTINNTTDSMNECNTPTVYIAQCHCPLNAAMLARSIQGQDSRQGHENENYLCLNQQQVK